MPMTERRVLPNGVRILTEHVPGVRSAALGVWVGVGSRRETAAQSGAAHFIEHMSFKGTSSRTAAELAQEMDAMGGQLNAYTTKEDTVFYAWVLDTHLRQAADVLCDMLFHSRFDQADVETERGVILEEMGMCADDPEDLCAERLTAAVYKGCPLARPILGSRASLARFTGESLRAWQKAHYVPSRLVVTMAGSFTDADAEDLRARFSHLEGPELPPEKPALYTPAFTVKKKTGEQNHLTLAFPGLPLGDPRRFTLQLLSSILGGGMSSRLWQKLREEEGLCYSVYTYGAGHADTGLFVIYAATGADTEAAALEAMARQVREFTDRGVTQAELDRAREQSKANVLMGLESVRARMSALGRGELLTGAVLSAQEVIDAYDAVTGEDVRALAEELLDFRRLSLSAVGRVKTEEEYRKLLGAEP